LGSFRTGNRRSTVRGPVPSAAMSLFESIAKKRSGPEYL
jgi:hypothetical protein